MKFALKLPVRWDGGWFYQKGINGIVCEGGSKTNRYYHYFQLLFFGNFLFECASHICPRARNDSQQRSNCERTVADYFGGLRRQEFPPK